MKINILWKGPIPELNDKEVHFIQEYNTLVPHGYNLMTGGGSNGTHCAETRKKISKAVLLAYAEGRLHCPTKGKRLSEEHKKNISISNKKAWEEGRRRRDWKNQPLSEEHKKKVSESVLKRHQDPKFRKKMEKKGKKLRTGTVSLYVRVVSGDWVHLSYRAKGPYPKCTSLGFYTTPEKAEAALNQYKSEHPDEFYD